MPCGLITSGKLLLTTERIFLVETIPTSSRLVTRIISEDSIPDEEPVTIRNISTTTFKSMTCDEVKQAELEGSNSADGPDGVKQKSRRRLAGSHYLFFCLEPLPIRSRNYE